MGLTKFELQLVHRVPENLELGRLYVCFDCDVVVHLCACGCGKKVVLPIAPDCWAVKYDGESVSLEPSIGNFQFPCHSHYWIRHNRVVWVNDKNQSISKFKPKKCKKKRDFLSRLKSLI